MKKCGLEFILDYPQQILTFQSGAFAFIFVQNFCSFCILGLCRVIINLAGKEMEIYFPSINLGREY